MIKNSATNKQVIITAVVFLAFLSIPITIGLVYYRTSETIKNQTITQLNTEGNIAAAALQIKLNRLVNIAASFAASPKIVAAATTGSWNTAASAARDVQNNVSFYDPYVDRIVFANTSAVEQSAYPTLEGGIGANLSQSDWFATMKNDSNSVVVSSVTKRHATPILNVVNIAAPIKNNDVVVGFVILQIPTNNFLEFGYALSTGTYGFTYIVDSHGNVVSHPKYSATVGVVNIASVTPVNDLIAHKSDTVITKSTDGNSNDVITYKTVPEYNWGVVIQEPYDEAFSSYQSIVNSIYIIEIVFLLIDIAICYLVFRFMCYRKDIQERLSPSKNSGFTLIELLVVIAIIAILSIVVVLTLNPAEMLRQSRDSTRISDFSTLKSAISLYLVDTANPNIASSTGGYGACYLSTITGVGTTTAKCGGVFANTYTGNSSTSGALFRKNDSTGWLPVNFSQIGLGTPLSSLPIDPVNNANYYYAYAATSTGGSYYFELDTFMESKKYGPGGSNDVAGPDGGDQNGIFEAGNKPGLNL